MLRFQRLYGVIAIGCAVSLPLASAVSPVIGFMTATGTVELDASPVARHGTLFEGSTIETYTAGSQLEIPREMKASLGAASRAQVFRDHMILEKGDSQLSGSSHYWVQARGLRIRSLDSDAVATVSLRGDKQVLVMAQRGPVRIANAQGLAIAWVNAGKTLQLEPPAPGAAITASTLTGCLQEASGHYFLIDQTTALKVEVRGPGFEQEIGNQVTITGVRDASGIAAADASQLIDASSVTRISTHCVVAAGNTAPAGTGTVAKTGGFTTTKAIIAGVVVVGGAAIVVGVVKADSKSTISQ
jgi:hypothetical protein